MNIVTELNAVLAEEQEILLSGDFARLEALAEKKSQLVEALAATTPEIPEETCQDIRDRAAHNEALLGSARRGIQAAMSQLREYSSGEHQSTYSREGERQPLSRPVSVTQKY